MINRLFLINKPSSLLTKEQESTILHDIEMINFKRMKLLLIILLIVEILFIAFNDVPNLMNIGINVPWNDKRFFILHLLLSLVSIMGIIIIKILIKNDRGELERIYDFIVPILIIIILVFISIINGLDQIKAGNVSSVFIANILICSATIMIRFPVDLLVYSIPFSTYIGGLVFFQKDSSVLITNIVNGSIFFAAVIIISKIVYDSQFNQISKNIILEEVNLKLNYMSNHDPLTGLANRRYFETLTKEKIEIMNQSVETATLVLVDIDHFKNINDQFGHPIGDIVLKEVSTILSESIKATDLATRWGGEEFLILLFQTSISEAYELAAKIREAIENKIMIIDNFKINITVSLGITQMKADFSYFDASYKLADKALYQAKNQGKNQIVVASVNEED